VRSVQSSPIVPAKRFLRLLRLIETSVDEDFGKKALALSRALALE
jgi:hypothetical protein